MIDSTQVYSFLTYYIVLAILLQWVSRSFVNRRMANSLTLFAPLLILIIPFSGLPVAYYLRGATGDLSVITVMLLSAALARTFYNIEILNKKTAGYFYLAIFIIGALFYITSLGYGQFDPYGLTYESLVIPFTLLASLVLLAWKKQYGLAMLLLVPMIAYETGLLESNNIWDYILDPFLWVYATIRTFKYLFGTIKKHKTT